ncbi:uncharacterized protein DS421_17g580510 [Arachis hypogaea]|nr:uncharacterized protein DS421_17g580510 [Arachis hypogaea]
MPSSYYQTPLPPLYQYRSFPSSYYQTPPPPPPPLHMIGLVPLPPPPPPYMHGVVPPTPPPQQTPPTGSHLVIHPRSGRPQRLTRPHGCGMGHHLDHHGGQHQ